MIKRIVWFLFFAALAVSCLDDPDCYNLNSNVIGISFKKIADGRADTVAILGVSLNGTDSIFYDTTFATDLLIPLNFLQNETAISFKRPGPIDPYFSNLILGYTARAQFVSEDCGERFVVSDLKLIASDFDSTRLVNATPTSNPSTNIIVYRCPISDLVRMSFRQWDTNEEDTVGAVMTNLVNGITDDFTIYNYYVNQELSTARLPINTATNATTFHLDFVEYGVTSLSLGYTGSNEVLYASCGEQTFFSNLTITSIETEFDRVVVEKDSIYDPPLTNVTFYKCPETSTVKIVFRPSDGGTNNVPVDIVKIKADYTTEEFYTNQTVSTVELPLNENADVTTFTFTLADGDKILRVGYDRAQNTYHEVCNQTEINNLEIQSSTGFADSPKFLEQVQFPIVNNIAIIVD